MAAGLSPFGTMGQGGNVWEWEESALDFVNNSAADGHGLCGGSWTDTQSKFTRIGGTASGVGLRVVMVPEPGSLVLGLIGMAALVCCRGSRE